MTTITSTNLRKNMFEILNNTAKFNEVINVPMKEGNVVIISDSDYRSLLETVYLHSKPGLVEAILEADQEPITEGIPADEVDW